MINNLVDKYKNLNDNDRIAYKNIIFAFIIKGFALFITLFTMPCYIRFFNNDEVLGFWFTILSIINWILNFDLGIGNGLRNHLSASIAKDNKKETKHLISSAYFSIGIIVIILGLILSFLIYFLDLNSIFKINVDVINHKYMFISIIIVVIGILAQFWLKLINSILYAIQKSSINNFLVLITNFIILISMIIIPSKSNNINIVVMSIVHSLAVIFPLLVTTMVIFHKNLKYAKPKLKYISKKFIKKVLSLGGIFFFIQLSYMIIMSSNEYLITYTTGSANVVAYQAYYKIFTISSTVFALALTPVWSIITKAKVEKNVEWISKTYNNLLKLNLLFCFIEFVLLIFLNPIISIWLGENINFTPSYIFGSVFAIYGCLLVTNSVFSTFVNGLSELKIQFLCYLIGAFLKVPLSIFLVNVFDSWIGVILSNIVCMGLYTVVEPFFMKKYFNNIRNV